MYNIQLHVHTIPSLNGRHPSILLLGYLPAAILHENKQMGLRKILSTTTTIKMEHSMILAVNGALEP
jgi:hypothetical protein